MSNSQAVGTLNTTPSGGGINANTDDQEANVSTKLGANESNNTQSSANRKCNRRSQSNGKEHTW